MLPIMVGLVDGNGRRHISGRVLSSRPVSKRPLAGCRSPRWQSRQLDGPGPTADKRPSQPPASPIESRSRRCSAPAKATSKPLSRRAFAERTAGWRFRLGSCKLATSPGSRAGARPTIATRILLETPVDNAGRWRARLPRTCNLQSRIGRHVGGKQLQWFEGRSAGIAGAVATDFKASGNFALLAIPCFKISMAVDLVAGERQAPNTCARGKKSALPKRLPAIHFFRHLFAGHVSRQTEHRLGGLKAFQLHSGRS